MMSWCDMSPSREVGRYFSTLGWRQDRLVSAVACGWARASGVEKNKSNFRQETTPVGRQQRRCLFGSASGQWCAPFTMGDSSRLCPRLPREQRRPSRLADKEIVGTATSGDRPPLAGPIQRGRDPERQRRPRGRRSCTTTLPDERADKRVLAPPHCQDTGAITCEGTGSEKWHWKPLLLLSPRFWRCCW